MSHSICKSSIRYPYSVEVNYQVIFIMNSTFPLICNPIARLTIAFNRLPVYYCRGIAIFVAHFCVAVFVFCFHLIWLIVIIIISVATVLRCTGVVLLHIIRDYRHMPVQCVSDTGFVCRYRYTG